MTKIRTNLKLTKSQQEAARLLHLHDTRYLICCWSRQSGKSVFAELMVIEYLFRKNQNVCYVTPTFDLARKVFKEIVQILQPTGFVKSANKSLLVVEMTTGSTLKFFSAEAYKAIRGNTAKGLLVIDEAAFMADVLPNGENLWGNIIQPITKANKPKILMISTPAGKQGFFYEFFLKAEAATYGTDDYLKYRSFRATIFDDQLIDNEGIKEIRESISPLAFKQEYECEFLANALTAFGDYEKQFVIYKKSIDFNETLWAGLDFSSTGEDKTVLTFINKDGYTWQYQIDGSLDEKYKKIAELLDKPNKLIACYAEINSMGVVMLNEIQKQMRKNKSKIKEWTTSASTKNPMVALMQTAIANGNIWFDIENKVMYGEMGTFTYTVSKAQKISYAAKAGFHDDRVMSCCMALQAKEDYPYSGGSNYAFVRTRPDRI